MASRHVVQEFSPSTETITTYLHRMELYFKANKVTADLQVATLLTHIGSDTFQRLCDLVAPELPGNKTLAQLQALLKRHFEPKKLRAAERYNFRLRKQAQGETVAEFDAALRRLAKDCEFTGDRLEEELQDQIILGINDDQVRKQLLSEEDLTYKRTLQIAQAAGNKDHRSFGKEGPSSELFKGQAWQKPATELSQPKDCMLSMWRSTQGS